jgi:hypothetical protein
MWSEFTAEDAEARSGRGRSIDPHEDRFAIEIALGEAALQSHPR